MDEALRVHKLLIAERKTLALAESCTGGRIAAALTAIPGASTYFLGSLVVYSNAMKTQFLGVSEKLLQEKGAVSQEVVLAMLEGLFKTTKADVGAAVTGIAGPTGGTKEKPVGTVWIAVASRGKTPVIQKVQVQENEREAILDRTVRFLLQALQEVVQS